MRLKWIAPGGMAALALLAAGTSVTGQTPPLRQGFDIRVGAAPAPVRIGDRTRLVYELQLSNFAPTPLEVSRIEAVDGGTGRTLADLQGAALASALGGPPVVGPNAFVLAHVEASVDGAAPDSLRHRVTFSSPGGVRTVVENGHTPIDAAPLPVLGPPLSGGPWVAVYQPDMERGHRRVAYAVDGKARVPGRFAIDWIKVDETGATGAAGGTRLDSNLSFGAEVLAVADGVVAATRDGVPDPADLEGVDRVALEDATGNYVAIDIGGGRYAFYEHLSPGLRVRPGDRVRRGQVIGTLGFTGQASGPHLHFHVSDAPDPLPAEGRPYVLEGFRVVGRYPSIQAFGRGQPWERATEADGEAPSFPAHNVVVRFEDAPTVDR
ncbi:M23 family metallopeptidase [Brevundimonas sp.]|uniref:M23 family metallopeptidase n=1 Tax=Brevundimonas sp. TaxID=1871086 RepID=UPI002BC7FE14|nr:M23 family metallopeptidase [Brevundimonas sp.]HWQ86191.1 M23 family metallopeptidase [Brevundimonas sp.]